MPVLYLIPSLLHEEGLDAIPASVLTAVKDSQVIFAENERTTRRYLKKLDKTIVIDDYEWFSMETSEQKMVHSFRKKLVEGKNIALLSEAGCPGIADPGQKLIRIAQEMNIVVKPLVGPNSILLALMASGMNGQQFQFLGYLPIDQQERAKAIRSAEGESRKKNCTQVFIETPYRNNQLLDALLRNCQAETRLCIAADLTSPAEWIRTKKIGEWKKEIPDIHKRPAIFLLHAS